MPVGWRGHVLRDRLKGPTRSGDGRERLPSGMTREDYSSRDIRRRSLPDFLDTTVATVVKPDLR
jgi:hypothetical protein